MLNFKVLIIGKGSSSRNHIFALNKISKKICIKNFGNREFEKFSLKKKVLILNKVNPDIIVLCSPSSFHYKQFKFIEKKFKNKKVLIEKPLFNKKKIIPSKLNNTYFIGYNLRFHPVLRYIKNFVKNKKILSIYVNCYSYLPEWRNNKYDQSVSAQKKLGGGILLELSHEIDYLCWLFSRFNTLSSFDGKISNLNIDCTDTFTMFGCIGKKNLINLNLNFYSRISKRTLYINGDQFSLEGDLINNFVDIKHKNKRIKINFNKFKNYMTYKNQYLSIINKNFKDLCDLNQGIQVLEIIEEIEKKNEYKKKITY